MILLITFNTVSQTELPSADTTYWCVVRKLPDVYMETQHYVYKVKLNRVIIAAPGIALY